MTEQSVQEFSPRIEALAQAMKALEDPLEIEPGHFFAPGIYCRVLTMPAGSVIVSKIHKTEHFCVALTGVATVVNGADGTTEDVIAPRLMITKPGTQRALHIHETSTWATFHVTDKVSVEEIEKDIIAEDFNDPVLIEYRSRLLEQENES